MHSEAVYVYARILGRLAEFVGGRGEGRGRTMATLRPNWFLISPVFTAPGACSWMSWKRCLMPMLAVARAELRAQCLGRSRRRQRCCWRLALLVVQQVQVEVEVEMEIEVEEVNHVTRGVANAYHEVPSITDRSMQLHPATKGRLHSCCEQRASPRTPTRHLALIVALHPPVCVQCFKGRRQNVYGIYKST